jgi:hypothetical protein
MTPWPRFGSASRLCDSAPRSDRLRLRAGGSSGIPERCVASWLMVPSRYTSEICQEPAFSRIR